METIFATATAPVKSGVAIIRVSGPAATESIRLLTGKVDLKPRLAYLLTLKNPACGAIIDEALVLYFPSPASFTGEDIAEFHIHGSRAVIEELLEVLSSLPGARLAEPGEFSRRAFDNGKMDLTAAEGLADLIDAQTRAQARQAMRQKQGVLKGLYDRWRTQLIAALAKIEAYIDFPDEDLPESLIQQLLSEADALKNALRLHLDDNHRGEKLRNGLQAVILGAPNAGKSSLLNYLAKRDVAIVSDIAGTTRDVLEVHLDIGGYPVTLVDTAGLRESVEAIEKEGIRRALLRAEDADIRLLILDATAPEYDAQTLSLMDDNTLVIINKTDSAPCPALPDSILRYAPLPISVHAEAGMEALMAELKRLAEKNLNLTEDPVITRQRHRNLLQETIRSLEAFSLDDPLELASENLRSAAFSLGKITGHIAVEDILDDIFHNFCIGK